MFKTGCFILEGLNSFATVFYFWYLYFYMQEVFRFGNKANLALAALSGGVYVFAAWWGGKFAQKFGYFLALKLGFAAMALSLIVGLLVNSATGQEWVMTATILGMGLTWPTLEALVSEGETPAGLQRMLGIYNVVWAGTGALAYFVGGAALDKLGKECLFYIPATFQIVQLGFTFWLERVAVGQASRLSSADVALERAPVLPEANVRGRAALVTGGTPAPLALNPRPIARAKMFLRMAWLANPLAYIAVNTLLAVIPGLANRLGLSTMLAGFCCSLWCFARLGAFFLFWFWSAWHYRFRWLLAAYLVLIGAFAAILLVPSLPVLLLAQVLFGVALGLIYSSSLFYSMDVGEAKSEHGGIHEAAIGLGNFAGPAVGALSLQLVPQYPNSGAVAVCGLLILGLGGLVGIWWSQGSSSSSASSSASIFLSQAGEEKPDRAGGGCRGGE